MRVGDGALAGKDEPVFGRDAGGILDVDHGGVGEGGVQRCFERKILELEVGVVVVDFDVLRVGAGAEGDVVSTGPER